MQSVCESCAISVGSLCKVCAPVLGVLCELYQELHHPLCFAQGVVVVVVHGQEGVVVPVQAQGRVVVVAHVPGGGGKCGN